MRLFIVLHILNSFFQFQVGATKPHIIFILADDLGWNDVGFHGASEIKTPNIDALAYSGLILNNYYVTPICTPSRSALMTGKYPIHTGMQHTVLFGAEPRGLPLNLKILPQYLKEQNYSTKLVGKWHLGSFKKEYLPTYRGFDSHLGYWTGHQDYFDHTAVENPGWGFDMRRNLTLAYDLHGAYSTDVFTDESVKIIKEHDLRQSLFLYVAHSAVHSGNPYNPLPAPDETVEKFPNILNYKRRRFAAMLSKLDDSVGAVIGALADKGMLNNSIIIFSTDNGGPAAGFNLNAASNYPLRGTKNTLWEGGVRGAGVLFSPLIQKNQRISKQLFHITDWLPTLLSAIGAKSNDHFDGLDQWGALSQDLDSERKEILHNIDDLYGNAAVTIGPWKLIKGTTYNGAWDKWYGPSERNASYDASMVINSMAGGAVKSIGINLTPSAISLLRTASTIDCKINNESTCNPLKETCLFNIVQDPCELKNVAKEFPQILKNLEEVLAGYNRTAVPPGNLPLDPRGNPKFWDNTWTNFGDFI